MHVGFGEQFLNWRIRSYCDCHNVTWAFSDSEYAV